ncbi:solute carrier family 13 (sodium-dependent dicarboxylate transporter), member 2/3/5 [Anaerovirgula multivorans]|uniref:Solute carrier family 13 (Sodium-dependent dicarboxylate transporter), member 2/3/5 n=1 Tax=Anaerovirgula multivorans TaxID=312168 RepID=A0A239IXR1_9FIRM|nr:SLC13 family permease [Anaerovirgula multivorans]SNS97813.1 solute carrier family 13 (sodium-dependent dicarboxylate transporter), member 2/3/5 [Anaerovirgula multivorans]
MKKVQVIGLLLAITILIGMNFIPTGNILTEAGRNTLGILIAILILLITEPIPIGVTCILGIGLLVLFKAVSGIPEALNGYTNPIVFFVLVSFGISAAITKVPLSKRLLVKIMSFFGKDVKMILLSIMICAALISSIVSNVATTAIFITITLQFLNIYKDESERKSTGKSFMIGLPVASMIGGMITPAGSSLNLMSINLLEQLTGIKITFVQWMVCGIPIVTIMLPLAWLIIIKVYPPVELSSEDIRKYIETLYVPSRLNFSERYVLSLVSIMFALWVLSSWIPAFNITLVAIVGFSFLFLPKISILTWQEFLDSVSWAAFFLVGTIISIGNSLVANGVSNWIAATIFPDTIHFPIYGMVFVVGVAVFFMLIFVPVAPALISMLVAPLIDLAGAANISPVLMIMTLGLCVANCYLLPLDTVPLLTYMTGYYKISEMSRSTGLIQVCMVMIVTIWLPIALSILGIL